MIKLLIADDHQMFIDGIKALLKGEKEIRVVGEALNGNEVVTLLEKTKVDILLLDVNMPEMDGIETTRVVRTRFPEVRVIILTMHNRQEFIEGLVHEGAAGYILKNTGRKELLDAINTVQAGGTFFSKEVTGTIMKNLQKSEADRKIESVQLTEREKEVLKLIAREFSSKEIAEKLFISTNTVETHRKNLMVKLNAKNIAGLVKFAMQVGLLD